MIKQTLLDLKTIIIYLHFKNFTCETQIYSPTIFIIADSIS